MTLDKMLVWKTKRTVWSSTDFRKRQTVKTWTFNGCRLPAQYESWLCDWDCKNKNKGKQRHEREDNTGVLRLSVAKGMSRCGRWTFEIEYEWIYEFIMTCSMYSIYWFLHCTMEFYYMNLTCLPFFRFMYVSILLLSLHRACVRSVAVSCIPMTPMCRQNGSAIASVILATPLETGFFLLFKPTTHKLAFPFRMLNGMTAWLFLCYPGRVPSKLVSSWWWFINPSICNHCFIPSLHPVLNSASDSTRGLLVDG